MTKLEAWKTWSASAGAPGTEFTLEKSSHGKAFSYAWDAALAQPERKPLTKDEMWKLMDDEALWQFARAIEKAHGIGCG